MILIEQWSWCWICTALRFGPIFLALPMLSGMLLSWGTRIWLTMISVVALLPLVCVQGTIYLPTTPLQYLLGLIGELFYGGMIAVAMHLFCLAFQTGGNMLAGITGVSFGGSGDSSGLGERDLIERFVWWIAGVFFVLVGAHRWLVQLVFESLARYPLGTIFRENSSRPSTTEEVIWPGLLVEIPMRFGDALVIGIQIAFPAACISFFVLFFSEWIRKSLRTLDSSTLGGSIPFMGILASLLVFVSSFGWSYQQEVAVWADSIRSQMVLPGSRSSSMQRESQDQATADIVKRGFDG
jgi:flagellar biosynthesis protein FliR